MFLADFHIHSTFSDGKLPIPSLIDLYGSRGFGAIAITDHLCEEDSIVGKAARYIGHSLTRASFPIYLEILKSEAARAWDQYRMIVIPGVELSKNSINNHRSAHVLGLGISEFIRADADVADLVMSIKRQGALAIAAHPVSTRKLEKQTFELWNRKEELAPLFDAWEVASGPYLFDEVMRAKLPKVASSDLHHPRQLSSWKTVFDCERHQDAIFRAICDQELSFRFYKGGSDNDLFSCIRSGNLGSGYFHDPLRSLAGSQAFSI
jgi:hypothetical protein